MKVRPFRLWGSVPVLLALVSLLMPARVQGSGAAYVQAAAKASSGTAKTLSLSFPANTTAGNLIVVAFDYTSGAAPSSVSDTQGNVFTPVGNQLNSPGGALSRVYYANTIKGGADTVTVTLTANSSWIELYLAEYTGIDPVNPIDAQAGASGSTSAVSSGNATTTVAGDVIFGYCVGDWKCTVGSGFSARSTLNGNLIEDKVAGAAGSYAATGTATRGWTMQMVALKAASGTVGAPPVITSATSATGKVGTAFSYQITATNSPTSYGATGLPAGLSVNTASGLISGTPTGAGTSSVTLSATNAGGTGNATLTLTVNPAPPVITSATTATGTLGTAFSYQITATNSPTSFGATGLPAGLSVNSASGLISGTPTGAGTSSVTLSATNAGGTGNATLTLTVNPAPPVITSATSATGMVGTAFSYQITATNSPTSYGAAGLPAGLAVNSGTGLISGTPTGTGTSTVTLSATNSGGTGNATLTLTINPPPPVITSATTASGTVGTAFSYQTTATNSPTSYGAAGLPAGLSVNTASGLISGTPTGAGTSTVTLSATNAGGIGNATLTLTINPPPPVITSATTASGTVGIAFSYQITATNAPTSYGAAGLPAGLAVNSGTGLISGTPTGTGTSTVTLSATNSGGTGNATLTLTINNPASPVITSTTTASGTVGVAFSYQITATNSPTSFGATGLPAGLSVNSASGLISGTPTAAGASMVTLSATNAGGTGNATLTLTVNPAPPVMTSATTATGTVGSVFSYQITATNTPTNYGASGLPGGLTVNANTGAITGTPTAAGTSMVTLSATNAGGTGNATLTLTINPAPPVATPTFNPGAATYGSAQSVSITSTTSGATICYTTNGSTPAANTPGTCSAGTVLANGGSVTVSTSETLQAIGTENGFTNSAVGSASYTISACAQNLAVGNFTLCGESYKDVATGTNVQVNYSPTPNNGIIAWATWCFNSACNSSISGVTATIGDNINATESCFVASPHSPFITDGNGGGQGSGDFQQHYVWYCPSIPSGVTSFTMTPSNPNLSYLQLNITEWKAGSLAASCSPISACFENVDNSAQAGNSTGGTTATITTSSSTANSNDLIFAVTEVPCCSFTASPGTGYTGITVAPGVTPGMVSEAKAATAAGIQTATTTWTGGSAAWFGVIVPLIGTVAAPAVPAITSATTASGTVGSAFSYQITATNSPTSFGAAGLPAGLSVNTASGLISGTPTSTGTSTVTLSATNAGGTGNATLTMTITPADPPSFVQVAAKSSSGTAKTLSLSFPANTIAGDLILVAFDYTSGAAPSSVSDTQGNVFTPVGNQLNSPGGALSRVYYANTIKGGADTVTVTLTANSSWIEVYLAEYTGIDPANPIDAQAGASGKTSAVSSGTAATSVSGDVIFGYCVGDWKCTVGSGFSARSTFDGNLIEDKVAGAAGSYAATGTATRGWTMQMVALKPAPGTMGAPPVITSATSATGKVGTAFSYQITATNSPTSYGATGLPAGLSVNSASGLISGTPTSTGTSTVTLSATNSAGTGNATLTLTINPAPPVITSATTASGTVGIAFSYQITATNTPTSYGAAGLPSGLSVNTGTGLISGTPAGAGTSTVTLSATNAGGTGNATLTLTINNPVPAISSFSPASSLTGSVAQTLTINGSNFVSASTVTYNSVAHTATFISASQLTIQLSTSDQAAAGSFAVVVTNLAPGGGASTPMNFTVNNPVPSISGFSPASASAGSAAQTLTINGSNFLSTSTVTYNSVARAATFVSTSQLTIQLSTADQATAGSYPVVVTNPAPGGGASNSADFMVNNPTDNPVPSITGLSPAWALVGAAAQSLTITGSNFLSASTVTYNGIAHTPTFVSSTQLTIQLSVMDQATAGAYPVVVTNPPPGGGPSTAVNFTVTTTGPLVSLSTPGLFFGYWTLGTTSPAQLVTLTNTGDATLTIGSIGLTGANIGDFAQTNDCGSSVLAGNICTISVTLAPTVDTGNLSAAVTIMDDASGSPQSVTLSGTGLTSAVQFMTLDPTKTFLMNSFTGKPVFITGDAPQTLMVQVNNADVLTYLNDRSARGFNALWVYPVDKADQTGAPANFFGQMPFNGADFTNENETYWQNVDLVVQEAQALGITLMMDPGFVGLRAPGGYLDSYLNSSDAVISAYGQWMGNRYKGYSNIIWSIGGDSNTPNISGLKQKMSDLATGIAAADPNHLITSEECPVGTCGVGYNSTLDIWGGPPLASWVGLNGDYTQYGEAQSQCAAQYALLTAYPAVPPFQIEDWYELEHSMTELQLREEGYWEILSGCYLGRYFGNNAIWTMGGPNDTSGQTWQSQLGSMGSVSQAWLGALFRSREHWKMVPDSNNTVLTAGFGNGTTISAASRTSDGQTIIAYIPNGNATSITIDMTKISSVTNTVHGWWFNPQTGATTDLGTFANTGLMMFTPPDSNDWVLVLDDAGANLPAPGSANL